METFESSWEGVDEDDYVPLDFSIEELLDEVSTESNAVEIVQEGNTKVFGLDTIGFRHTQFRTEHNHKLQTISSQKQEEFINKEEQEFVTKDANLSAAKPGKLKPKKEIEVKPKNMKGKLKKKVVEKISLNDLLENLKTSSTVEHSPAEKLFDTEEDNISIETVRWSSSDSQLQPIPIVVKTLGGRNSVPLQVSWEDSVQVIIQSLTEAAETCFVTSFALEFGGKRLDEFVLLSEIENLKSKAVFQMVEVPYDERSARVHVRRLKEILAIARFPCDYRGGSTSLFGAITKSEPKFQKNFSKLERALEYPKEEEIPSMSTSIKDFYPLNAEEKIECIKGINFSGWNPPSGNRRLCGDLFYLEVDLLVPVSCGKESISKLFVTASHRGFFVNSTRDFSKFESKINPIFTLTYFTLADLLCAVSQVFQTNFDKILKGRIAKDPFEMYPVPHPHPILSWLGPPTPEISVNYDLNRAEDYHQHYMLYHFYFNSNSYHGSQSIQDIDQFRDWNEELQSSRELAKTTIRERIIRDHAIVKVNNDFVEAATRGAIAVINKTVPPLNPMDPKPVQMFIYRNIFFSFAIDTNERYEEVEGRYTYASANNDLKGVHAYNHANVEGLYTLATAIIDYKGWRIIAQSIIPGIFNPSTVVYNSCDFTHEKKFENLLSTAASRLNLRPHDVIFYPNPALEEANLTKIPKSFSATDGHSSGTPTKSLIYCSGTTKGIVGTDSRRYVIDLCRVTPQDANYKGKDNIMAILRPELLQSLNEKSSLFRKIYKVKEDLIFNPDTFACLPDPTTSGTEFSMENSTTNGTLFLKESVEQLQKDEKLLTDIAEFLTVHWIPAFVNEFGTFSSMPVDGTTLSAILHHRGINLRYLGVITKLTQKDVSNAHQKFLSRLCIREMIARGVKHTLRVVLFQTDSSSVSLAVSLVLNSFFGMTETGFEKILQQRAAAASNVTEKLPVVAKTVKKNKKQKKKNTSPVRKSPKKIVKETDSLNSPESDTSYLNPYYVWDQILFQVEKRFQYQLSWKEAQLTLESDAIVPMLRNICQKTGIQITPKDYFSRQDSSQTTTTTESSIFKPEDIQDIFPVIKHTQPKSADGHALLEAGVKYLSKAKLEVAFELLSEALVIFSQVYGPMHHATAVCFSNMAMVFFQSGDAVEASLYQQKAVYINERVLGLDHHETAQAYGNLALFCHKVGQSKLALNYVQRALYLGFIACGIHHPDNATSFTNVGMILQELKDVETSLKFFLKALFCTEKNPGLEQQLLTAAISHAIAINYCLLSMHKEALEYEKKNFSILVKVIGNENDPRIQESSLLLKEYTQKALQAAKKKEKEQQQQHQHVQQ